MPEPAESFDERAERYDRAYDAPGGFALRSRMAAVLELLGPGPGEALDAGMGPGRLLAELAERGWTVSGIDASGAMVALAHRRLPAATERLVEGVIESLPFTDASFDAVAVTGVLEHSEIERALRELARVLRPGGKAVFSYPNPNGLYDIWKTRGWYRFVRTAKRLARRPPLVARGRSRALQPHRFQELLRAAGLEPERVEYTGLAVMPAPLDAVFHRTTDRLARRFEGSGPGLRRRLADQVLYVARKTDTTETPAS